MLNTPIILLTAKSGTEAKIEGLEIGADDYLTKPFNPKELLLRVLSILKRSKSEERVDNEIPDNESGDGRPIVWARVGGGVSLELRVKFFF